MDVTNIILKLESALTTNPLDQQMISKAIQLLKLGVVEYVTSLGQLPLANENIGKLYYVERDGLYWANPNLGWDRIYKDTEETMWTWGSGGFGELGNNAFTNQSSPVSVVGGFTDWSSFDAHLFHTVGIRSNGTAWAWGYNRCSRLGDGTTINKSSPVSVVGGFTDWCQSAAGGSHSLGLRKF